MTEKLSQSARSFIARIPHNYLGDGNSLATHTQIRTDSTRLTLKHSDSEPTRNYDVEGNFSINSLGNYEPLQQAQTEKS